MKIDQGMIPAQRIELEVRSDQKLIAASSGDFYGELKKLGELRKDGIVSEAEFSDPREEAIEIEEVKRSNKGATGNSGAAPICI